MFNRKSCLNFTLLRLICSLPLLHSGFGVSRTRQPGKWYRSAPFCQSLLNYYICPWGGLEGPHRPMQRLFVPLLYWVHPS